MNFEFMTIDTPLPPCMPFPKALTGFPVSSTAKVMYCRMLDAMLSKGQEDENGILFVCFPVTAIAAVLSRSPMTVKRSLNELETAGLIMRVRQGIGEPNRIYVLIPKISAEVTRDYPSFCAQRARRLFRLMQNRPYLLLVSTHYIESHSAGRIRAQSPRRRCCHSSTLGEPRRVQRKTD